MAKDCSGPRSGSVKPAAGSPEYAVSRLRTVRSLAPLAAASAAGRSHWVSTPRQDLPRLRGVVRAFLWMFIRAAFSGAWQAETRMANLLTVHP